MIGRKLNMWLRPAMGTALAGIVAAGSSGAAERGPLVAVSPGVSPFRNCAADDVPLQERVCSALGAPCVNYPNTEIEPWVDVNPTNPQNLIVGWQQDRWSNGGARGDVSAYSKDGGTTWTKVLVPGTTLCSGGGGLSVRASDPWVSFSPNGTAYFMTLGLPARPLRRRLRGQRDAGQPLDQRRCQLGPADHTHPRYQWPSTQLQELADGGSDQSVLRLCGLGPHP